jgi:glycosyltransferase involved in cell wall biosynthesis
VEPDGKGSISKILARQIFNLTFSHADAIKLLNFDQEAFCRQQFPEKRTYKFPPFVATDYFQSLESHQGDYLLSIGHPFDLKGMDVLIAAFKRIADKHPCINLRIMGYCPQSDMQKYKALVDGDPRITFIDPGWIEEVGEQIRDCYALVNASRTEALGRVHIEAMACGKPVVATRTNGAIESIEEGVTGLLCDVGNVSDLAAKLDSLLANPDRAAEMGRAGMARMNRIFSETSCTDAYHAMLEEVTRKQD